MGRKQIAVVRILCEAAATIQISGDSGLVPDLEGRTSITPGTCLEVLIYKLQKAARAKWQS